MDNELGAWTANTDSPSANKKTWPIAMMHILRNTTVSYACEYDNSEAGIPGIESSGPTLEAFGYWVNMS